MSGYYGGWVDAVIMRVGRRLLRLPLHPVRAAHHDRARSGLRNVFIAIGVLELGHVRAPQPRARCSASRPWSSSRRRGRRAPATCASSFATCCPTRMAPIYVAMAMGVGGAIVTEAALSFLGIGIQPPDVELGHHDLRLPELLSGR